MKPLIIFVLIGLVNVFVSCSTSVEKTDQNVAKSDVLYFDQIYSRDSLNPLLTKYTPFTLTTDMSKLSENEKKLIGKLIEAGEIIEDLFWYESYGDKDELLNSIKDEDLKTFTKINYGPWDRLDGNTSFIDGIDAKQEGANFYPSDMTKEEFESAKIEDKESLYTFLRRDDQGELVTVPYHKKFEKEVKAISGLLLEAAELSENEALTKYLKLRAEAMLNDEYQPSDMAWLDMKDNHIDVVIGPIETYEDQLFGYKAAHECYVLVKDMEWSERLSKYAQYLPDLQKGLPVPEKYKKEEPGRDTELNAYDVIYYSGDCNSGSKTIAINLPNDEEVQLAKGTRRLQLKNAMQAKFEKILVPIAEELITPEQRKHITFDAFFANTMFHEVAHGLGIKNTINGKGTVRKALKEHSSALEEGKADMLGLYMIRQLHQRGEIEGDLKDYYVTFMTSIFRSVRFGASSAHGKANMIRFNYFDELNAFVRDPSTGYYTVSYENLEKAMESLSELILTLQGDGNYNGVAKLVEEKGKIKEALASDLNKLSRKGIPVDVVFNQGVDVLGI
ncbi:MAG: Zn-dependent hydrolase [Bacteroidia bacterium]|nr:Zn-dependent hydrolase [Bacteroidia bacterium]